MLTINQAVLSLPESIQAITKKAWINTSRLNHLFDYAGSESIYFDLKLHEACFKAYDLGKQDLFYSFCEIEYEFFLEELDSIDSREEEIISRRGSRYYFHGDKIHDIYAYSDCEKVLDFSLFIDGSRLGAGDFVERVAEYIEDGYPLEELEKDLAFYIEEVRYVVKASIQIMQDYKKIYNYVDAFKAHQVENFLEYVEANSY